ncbi:MAG: MFS transporter [Betaproteobacteria bacterium]|nr:MFS transporter [Betaproteobacteria bacterium]
MAEASASQSLISGRQRLGWALLLAALSSVGPFAIDTYLPAFEGIARSLQATPVQMQQSLSVYLIAFAVMNLFHGSISDAVGRKPVVLAGLAMFSLASIGCALATTIDALLFFRCLQGLCAGVGMVVSRAMVRDLFPPEDAQRMLSIVAIFFGVAPAIAPWIGGLVFIRLGWEAVFWFLAGLSGLLLVLQASLLPESLKPEHRQSIALAPMFKAYRTMLSSPRFLLLCVSSALPAQFLGVHLRLEPDQYYWLFVVTVAGMMIGSALSSRLSGRFPPMRQVVLGLWIGAAASALNIALTLAYPGSVWMAIAPIGVYTLGWALMVPAVTVRAIDLYPSRRGMASSMQSFIGGVSNSLVAGVLVPAVMHSLLAMALSSAAALVIGALAWFAHSRMRLKPLDA